MVERNAEQELTAEGHFNHLVSIAKQLAEPISEIYRSRLLCEVRPHSQGFLRAPAEQKEFAREQFPKLIKSEVDVAREVWSRLSCRTGVSRRDLREELGVPPTGDIFPRRIRPNRKS